MAHYDVPTHGMADGATPRVSYNRTNKFDI
jgi:hypothetical protein